MVNAAYQRISQRDTDGLINERSRRRSASGTHFAIQVTLLAAVVFAVHYGQGTMVPISAENSIAPKYFVLPVVKMFQGGIETDSIPYFQTLPIEAESDRSRVIIDVGANEGHEAILAVKNGYIVYAFEPQPVTFQSMVENFKRENLTFDICEQVADAKNYHWLESKHESNAGHAILFPFGVGQENGTIEIHGDGTTASALDESFTYWHSRTPQVRLDDIIKEKRVFLLKTDIQGYDYFAFQGARGLFQSSQVDMILFELWPRVQSRANITSAKFFDLVQKEFGFNPCFDLNPRTQPWEGSHRAPIIRNFSTEWFAKFADDHMDADDVYHLGWYDDILCINSKYV